MLPSTHNPSRAQQRRKKAFEHFLRLSKKGYRYRTAIEKTAERFFYSTATIETIILIQRKKLRQNS